MKLLEAKNILQNPEEFNEYKEQLRKKYGQSSATYFNDLLENSNAVKSERAHIEVGEKDKEATKRKIFFFKFELNDLCKQNIIKFDLTNTPDYWKDSFTKFNQDVNPLLNNIGKAIASIQDFNGYYETLKLFFESFLTYQNMVQKLAPTLITPWLDANFKFPDIKKNMLDKAQKKCQTVQNYDDLCKLIENMKFHADMYNAERKDFNDDAMFYIKNQNKELYEDKEKLSAIISKLNPIFEKYYYEQLVTSESHEQVKANYLAKAHSVVNTLLQSNISKEQTNKGWNLETFIESFHKKTK